METLAFYEIEYGCCPPSWIYGRKCWDHPQRPICVGYPL